MSTVSKETYPAIEVQEPALQQMLRDAETAFPYECCGFFFGNIEDNTRRISKVLEVNNSVSENKERRFLITAKDYMKAERNAVIEGLDLLGVYHSHPNHPAIPSIHDLEVALPHFSYIIISVQDAKAHHWRSWQLDDQGLFAEEGKKQII